MQNSILISSIIALALFTFLGFEVNKVDHGKEITKAEWENLKVLPQDITEDALKDVMRAFNEGLGVKCNFCHAKGADGKMDFSSDANYHKDIARHMLTMTMEINQKYFEKENPEDFKVTCFTCHQGSSNPKTKLELDSLYMEKRLEVSPPPAPPSPPSK